MSPSRRQVLGGGLGLAAGYLLVGCGGGTTGKPPVSSAEALPTSRTALTPTVQLAITNEQGLLRAYDAVLAAYPSLAAVCAVPRDHHRAHLTALGGQPAPGAGDAIVVPPDPRAAAQLLLGLEQAAAGQRQTGAVTDLANGSLLAAIAAAEAVHADLLTTALPSVGS